MHEENNYDLKGCVQLISNETNFSDIWFSGVKTAEEEMDEVVHYCWSVKRLYKGFV